MNNDMQHLFVYGTLAPGRPNEHILADIEGQWTPGSVQGTLLSQGWGAALGYPGLKLNDSEETVEGVIFSSAALKAFWPTLDAFEGEEYERKTTQAKTSDGTFLTVHVYALKDEPSG